MPGSRPERACVTRARDASVRNPAISTAGGGACVDPPPVPWRTASANESRSGAWAWSAAALPSARIRAIRSRYAMEVEIDVSVEIAGDVESFGHAGRERLAGDDRVHERRHGKLRRHHHIHRTKFAGFNTPLDDAGHEPMSAHNDFLVVEAGQLGEV